MWLITIVMNKKNMKKIQPASSSPFMGCLNMMTSYRLLQGD